MSLDFENIGNGALVKEMTRQLNNSEIDPREASMGIFRITTGIHRRQKLPFETWLNFFRSFVKYKGARELVPTAYARLAVLSDKLGMSPYIVGCCAAWTFENEKELEMLGSQGVRKVEEIVRVSNGTRKRRAERCYGINNVIFHSSEQARVAFAAAMRAAVLAEHYMGRMDRFYGNIVRMHKLIRSYPDLVKGHHSLANILSELSAHDYSAKCGRSSFKKVKEACLALREEVAPYCSLEFAE
jgi:hypothetical protein